MKNCKITIKLKAIHIDSGKRIFSFKGGGQNQLDLRKENYGWRPN
jgi:hypothetical protein